SRLMLLRDAFRVLMSCGRLSISSFLVRGVLPPHLFFFNDTATTEIYTLSLHTLFRSPALPLVRPGLVWARPAPPPDPLHALDAEDRKSTRLNSSHSQISYAVFCLKKKTIFTTPSTPPSSHKRPSKLPSSAAIRLSLRT